MSLNDKNNNSLKRIKHSISYNDNKSYGHYGPNGYYVCAEDNGEVIEATFENKLRQSRDETKSYYSIIKNELLSFNCVSEVFDQYEEFKLYDFVIAKLAIYCGMVRVTLLFNNKKSFNILKQNIIKCDEILVSNGYVELYVDSTDKCNRAIDLINVLMRDIQIEKNKFYEVTDYSLVYTTLQNVRFAYKENFDQDIPEMVVVGPTTKENKSVKWLLLVIVALVITLSITACVLYKTKKEQDYPVISITNKIGDILADSYTVDSVADIFNDPLLDGKKIIYPGREETYYFYVSNENDYRFSCSINFSDVNEDLINMKYRLRIADVNFPNEEWKDISEIGISNFTVDAHSKILCALDWTWLSSDNDTELGIKGMSTYKLGIKFSDFKKVE